MQWNPPNVITLVLCPTDYINQIITMDEASSYLHHIIAWKIDHMNQIITLLVITLTAFNCSTNGVLNDKPGQ